MHRSIAGTSIRIRSPLSRSAGFLRRGLRTGLVFGVAGLVFLGADRASAQSGDWAVIDLGTHGGNWSRPYDINESGELVGTSQIDPNSTRYHGWYWTLDTGLVEIPTDPTARSKARSINNAGLIAGWSSKVGSGPHAMYIENNVQRDLGTFGGDTSKARQINEKNTIVGFAENSAGQRIAFRWRYDTKVLEPLGTLGGDESEARSVNNFDKVVGWFHYVPTQKEHAFIWDDQNGMRDLGTLGGDGSAAYGINDLDMVTGDSNSLSGFRHAFMWTESTGMESLGTLGGRESLGRGINNLGQIVGRAEISTGETHGFVWKKSTGMVDVNDLTAFDEEWIIDEVRSINDVGYMTGTARQAGMALPHAVLVVPPLSIEKPVPGLAGEKNTFVARGAIPGARVLLLASIHPGQVRIPFCFPATQLDFAKPILIGDLKADGTGIVEAKRRVRSSLAGTTVFFQAVEVTEFGCRKSTVVEYQFPN